MELVRDMLVPVANGAGALIDTLLPPEAPRSESDDQPAEPSFRQTLAAYLALIPAVDFLSDCAMFATLLSQAEFG